MYAVERNILLRIDFPPEHSHVSGEDARPLHRTCVENRDVAGVLAMFDARGAVLLRQSPVTLGTSDV